MDLDRISVNTDFFVENTNRQSAGCKSWRESPAEQRRRTQSRSREMRVGTAALQLQLLSEVLNPAIRA